MQTERIISVEYIGTIPTLDIKVDSEDHLFLANGIVTSNSHSYAYAHNSYLGAYCKAHYPKEFFTASLRQAKSKIKPQQEVYELITNAKSMDIFVQPPDLRRRNKDFDLIDKLYKELVKSKKATGDLTDEEKKKYGIVEEQTPENIVQDAVEAIREGKIKDKKTLWNELSLIKIPDDKKVKMLNFYLQLEGFDTFGRLFNKKKLETEDVW